MRNVVRASAVVLLTGIACSHSPLGLSVNVPASVKDGAEWFEIGAYENGNCGALLTMLPGGLPEGFTAREAFKKGDSPPGFGDIPNGAFAFAAVARDQYCAVVAKGCAQVDASHVDDISINLTAIDTPAGKCTLGSSCQAGQCVPATDYSDPSTGANCSLELLGSGPLANSSQSAGVLVSAPGIVPTNNGFLIVYREADTSGARLVVQSIDASGGATAPLKPALPSCGPSLSYASDGVGLLFDPSAGINGFATLSGCSKDGTSPALSLLDFTIDSQDTFNAGGFFLSPAPSSDQTTQLTLGAARPATLRTGGNLMTFVENGIAHVATLDANAGIGTPSGTFGETGVTNAWVTATDKVLALLSAGPGDPSMSTGDDDDAGADGGSGTGTGTGTGTTTQPSTLRLLMLAPSTDVSTVQTPPSPEITFPGTFASLASTGGRVIVVSDSGEAATASVTWRAYDFGNNDIADTGGFGVNASGDNASNVTATDIQILGDRAFVASLEQGQVALNVFNNATTKLTSLRSVSFSDLTRISGISTVRDGSVAVAASDSRVAVVWTTAKTLGANDADGGYAVFACAQ